MSVPATQVFVSTPSQLNVITVATPGPQGPTGPIGNPNGPTGPQGPGGGPTGPTGPTGPISTLQTPATNTASLPVPTQGLRYMVTDATSTLFGSVLVGNGVNIVPVYADGSVWRIG